MELRGTVGILTGASRGIGVYLAQHLAKAGVHLALAARDETSLEGVVNMVRGKGVRAITVAADVTRRSDLQRLVKRATSELGDVDLLVNNAGVEMYDFFEQADPNDIERILKTNVLGPELLTRYVLPSMIDRRKGHIVNMASAAGVTALPYNTVYASSKHALVGFSRSLREEMAEYNIGVSAICPGYVRDAGMFQDSKKGAKAPGMTGSVAPDRVASQTVRAILKNSPEVIVAPGVMRFVDVLHALSPRLTTAVARRSGVYRFNRPGEPKH